MEMRKFIVEIHPDGRVTCCEYEGPARTAKVPGWPDSGKPSLNSVELPRRICCSWRRAVLKSDSGKQTEVNEKMKATTFKAWYKTAAAENVPAAGAAALQGC